ncbi:MAG: ABC transporter permease [Syntrophothermus sp.]
MNSRAAVKILRDILSDKLKSFFLILAIAIGVFAVGMISGAYSVLKREMSVNYSSTVPADATLELDEGSFSQEIKKEVKSKFQLAEAELHGTVSVRMKAGGSWYPMLLFVVEDFNNLRTNKFSRVEGMWPPPEGTMLVEQTALRVMKAGINSDIQIQTPNGKTGVLKITGIVHDAGLAPAWQEQSGYGYITLSTLQSLGIKKYFDQLRIKMKGSGLTSESIEKESRKIVSYLEEKGFRVHELQVPPPGRHPHQGQMNAALTIFTAFSFMILILSSILVAVTVSTLMRKQLREIGIMKAIGAGSLQVSAIYFFMIISFSSAALLISVPFSHIPAGILVNKVAANLNLIIFDNSVPLWVTAVQVLSGLIIPLAVSVFPILKGGKITVREAIADYGVTRENYGSRHIGNLIAHVKPSNEIIAMSLRNTFRQRSKLLLTLCLLASGGALFITALSISKAWNVKLDQIYVNRLYDIEIKLREPVNADSTLKNLTALSGVKLAESYFSLPVSFASGVKYDITHTYPDKGHGSFSVIGIPSGTGQLNLPITEGKWLREGESRKAVLNHWAHSFAPQLKVGDSVALLTQGKVTKWQITGFSEDIGSPAAAYVLGDALRAETGAEGKSNMIRVSLYSRDKESVMKSITEIEEVLDKEELHIRQAVPLTMLKTAMAEHMSVLIGALLAMSVLLGIVGALGLMSAMTSSILDRTREIGVMKAIGAVPFEIGKLVVMEGLFTGVLSLPIAIIFSLITTKLLGDVVGNMSFKTPLPLEISYTGLFIWSVIIAAGAAVAALYPAWRAGSLTAREALIYE